MIQRFFIYVSFYNRATCHIMNRKILPHNKALNILRAENLTSFFAEVHYTLTTDNGITIAPPINATSILRRHYLLIFFSSNNVVACQNLEQHSLTWTNEISIYIGWFRPEKTHVVAYYYDVVTAKTLKSKKLMPWELGRKMSII